jgi:hypothetical protein
MGVCDYAMFLLIATYGSVPARWLPSASRTFVGRQGILRIHQRKTSSPLELPLTNEVLSALVKHLKRTRRRPRIAGSFSECALPLA